MLTKDQIQKALPANLKSAATQQLTDMVNNVTTDPILAEEIRNNFMSYTRVLSEGKYKTEDYLNAVVYVSFQLMGLTNAEAYGKTFPHRYQSLVSRGVSTKDIGSYVSAYNKNKLVNAIREQSLVPSWVLNQDIHQKAINHLASLMTSAQSEKVQCEAASALLTHLAKPKEAGALINIDMRENSGMNELKDMLERMADQQLALHSRGVPLREITHQNIIDVEPN